MLRDLASGRPAEFGPEIVSPSYLPDLVHVALDLLIDGEHGFWHLPNAGEASWAELAAMLATRAGLPPPQTVETHETTRIRALHSRRGVLLPSLASALDRFVADCEVHWSAKPAPLRIAAE
jgi:dTDP-4-dehydrorhamnose reductase